MIYICYLVCSQKTLPLQYPTTQKNSGVSAKGIIALGRRNFAFRFLCGGDPQKNMSEGFFITRPRGVFGGLSQPFWKDFRHLDFLRFNEERVASEHTKDYK